MPLLPYRKIWCDVFGGSGQVTIARNPSPLEVFNDRHAGVAAFFRAIMQDIDGLIALIELMPHSREMFKFCRESYMEDQDTIMRGAKWYYLVQASFAGRAEYFGRLTNGRGNIWKKIRNNLELFQPIHHRFVQSGIQIENLDWKEMFKDYDSFETVWYLDPPYVDSNVYQHGMKKADHLLMCHKIFELEGFVALSGYENDIYDKFEWDDVYSWEVSNKVATAAFTERNHMEGRENTLDRGSRKEFLWIKE
jgi:DNA adenine methylase